MTPGDLVITVEFTTEADEKTAYLSGLYAGSGVIKPNFARDNYDYTIAVPFGAEEFSISAQAENPYLEPELRQVSPESGDKELDDELTLTEGLNEYTITVTSQDTKTTQTYNIKVVKLPDLSLADFKITAGMDFEQYLPPFDTQTVYVPYANGITVVAEAADSGATVNSPVSANSLKVDVPTAVTVTVSKDLSGVDTSLTAKDYILNLYYGEGVPPDPLAEGGYVSFVPGNNGANSYDEVHRFLYNSGVAEELKFNTAPQDLTARVLVVAGGGGGGRGGFPSGGGGAGGMTETDSYPITEQAYAAVVGAGGAGGTVTGTQGANGENSSFGGGGNPLEAGGGGGGGGHSGQKDGGIRGGLAGSQPNGFSGGSAGYSYTAAGGNGAGGTGKSVSSSNDRNGFYQYSNSGGAGKGSDITGKEVTYAAGGGTAYARYATGVHGSPNTGNGGGGALDGAGGNGGSGIVIVRFPHTGVPAE